MQKVYVDIDATHMAPPEDAHHVMYDASDVDAWIKRMMLDTEESNLQALHDRIAELEHQLEIRKAAIEAQFGLMKQLDDARVLMRELWRLEGESSEELAQRCKAFMGGG